MRDEAIAIELMLTGRPLKIGLVCSFSMMQGIRVLVTLAWGLREVRGGLVWGVAGVQRSQ